MAERRNLRSAITLVEVIVVIAIIAVICAILFSVLGRARDQAKRTVCVSNLRQLGHATQLYQADYDGQVPVDNPRLGLIYGSGGKIVGATVDPLRPYGAVKEIYHCPEWHGYPPLDNPEVSNYIFRFVFDMSELHGNRAAFFRFDPQPSSVIAWDWNHTQSQTQQSQEDWWYFLRLDGSVDKARMSSVKKSYLVNGAWTFVRPPGVSPYYQFVFPNEAWPPVLTAVGGS